MKVWMWLAVNVLVRFIEAHKYVRYVSLGILGLD